MNRRDNEVTGWSKWQKAWILISLLVIVVLLTVQLLDKGSL